jgi:hypothetical protein
MAYTHSFSQSCNTPEASYTDSVASAATGDTSIGLTQVVNAYGGGANAIVVAFPATTFQSMVLWSTVPCVVTFTGPTVIDSVSTSAVTLVANVLRRVQSITGACTAASVGANTDAAGVAGVLTIGILYNA